MARDFTKNVSNFMSLGVNPGGNLVNGLAAMSVHLWVHADSFGSGAFDNRIIQMVMDNTAAMLILAIDGTASGSKLAVGARSTRADGLQTKVGTTNIGTAGYASLGAVLNYAGDTITPYVNGVAEGGGAVTFGATSYTHLASTTGYDAIGHDSITITTASQFDGRIAELAIWNVALSGANFLSLAGGAAANTVAAGNIIAYMKLLGNDSPETSTVGALTGTITGSLPQATHPTLSGSFVPFPIRRGNRGGMSDLTGGM